VYADTGAREAARQYREACEMVDAEHGRAAGETVTLFRDGEIVAEHNGARCDLLRIDAWRDGGSWTWNSWHRVARVPLRWCDLDPRALLREMRAADYVDGAGRLSVEDDGFNITIKARGTGEPLLALAYGAETN